MRWAICNRRYPFLICRGPRAVGLLQIEPAVLLDVEAFGLDLPAAAPAAIDLAAVLPQGHDPLPRFRPVDADKERGCSSCRTAVAWRCRRRRPVGRRRARLGRPARAGRLHRRRCRAHAL